MGNNHIKFRLTILVLFDLRYLRVAEIHLRVLRLCTDVSAVQDINVRHGYLRHEFLEHILFFLLIGGGLSHRLLTLVILHVSTCRRICERLLHAHDASYARDKPSLSRRSVESSHPNPTTAQSWVHRKRLYQSVPASHTRWCYQHWVAALAAAATTKNQVPLNSLAQLWSYRFLRVPQWCTGSMMRGLFACWSRHRYMRWALHSNVKQPALIPTHRPPLHAIFLWQFNGDYSAVTCGIVIWMQQHIRRSICKQIANMLE